MKKSLAAIFSVLALLVFTSSAFALHGVKEMFEYTPNIVKSKKSTITIGGSIRVRGEIANNTSDFRNSDDPTDGDNNDEEATYNERVRLHLGAAVSPNTRGFVELETGDNDGDTYTWGTCGEGASGIYEEGNCKPATFYLRQAYIAHQGSGLLGMMSGFKAGHLLLGLGNGLYLDHTKFGDDALIFWVSPSEGTEIALVAAKLKENQGVATTKGTATNANDADAYALTAETSMNGINLSGDVSLVNDNTENFGASDDNLRLWNFGLRGDADVQGINVKADIEFQTGRIENTQPGDDDMRLRGLALLVGADAKLGDINVGAEFGYGSGDDIDTEDTYEGFITSISSGQHYTYLYDQHTPTAGQPITTGSATTSSTYLSSKTNTGLNNTWYINVGASTNVNPDLKVSADAYYLQASRKVADDPSDVGLDDKNIGVELDGKVTYQIDNNFVYYVEAGYLWAGDFYSNVTGDKDEIDNPWSVRHGLVLKF